MMYTVVHENSPPALTSNPIVGVVATTGRISHLVLLQWVG